MADPKSETKSTEKAKSKDTEHAETRPDVDQVVMVSRTAAGDAHQNPGYELLGLPDDATEAQKAAAENRPEKRKS